MKIRHLLTAALIILTAALSARADTYTVQKGDSFYGICFKLGVKSQDLLDANPQLTAGVKPGQVLNLPAGSKAEAAEASKGSEDSESYKTSESPEYSAANQAVPATDGSENRLRPVNPPLVRYKSGDEPQATIVVMLPFDLNAEKPSRQAATALDFYRGMLIAADTLSRRVSSNIEIVAVDTRQSGERIRQFCLSDTFAKAAVVIAPEDAAGLSLVAREGMRHNTWVFNAFTVRDSSYITNPVMLQSYIPSALMYNLAVREFADLYSDAVPVIVHREGVRDDKADFIDRLRALYATLDRQIIDITFDGVLTTDPLEALPADTHYVLVPGSGSMKEFDKLAHTFIKAVEEAPGGSIFDIWGYPDWTAFRGNNLEQLHRMGATIYTRFYCDQESPAFHSLSASYAGDFGGAMTDAAPMPTPLGFDVGCYLIDNINTHGDRFEPDDSAYYGVQSSFHFVKPQGDPDGGCYNDELYIIRFDRYGSYTERIN